MAVAATNIASVGGGDDNLMFLPAVATVPADIASFGDSSGDVHCPCCIL